MKRIVLAAVAFSMLAAPMAQAQQRYDAPPRYQQHQQHRPHYDYGQKHSGPKHFEKKHFNKKQRWSKGKRVPEWQRRHSVRDYHRHGLKRPGRHQQWVKVDNDYLLISLATGIIAGIVVGR